MESYSETFVGTGKVTFYGVVSTYPSVSFYFSFPAQYKPEIGDWIALYPVGWSNLVGDFVVKKMVKPESLWNGIYGGDKWIGNMEFEMADWVQSVSSYSPVPMATKFAKDQYYQLVYVKNGDLVLGASKPFSLYTSGMFSGYSSYKPTYTVDGAEATGCLVSSFPLTSEFSVEPQTEKQLQQLISNVYNIEQSIGGWYKTPQASYNGVETYFKNSFGELYSKFGSTESLVDQVVLPHQIHKYWMTRLGEMEHMMMEQFKIEQAQRRIDQTYILAQLKTYERYVFYMMKNEQAINEYMRGAKLAAKLAEFEKKCYEIVKTHSLVEQPEYYVQKYEQLLKEKIELEIVERAKYLPKLRQLVKECLEFKLKEIQSMEHQYYTRFYKLIKTKLGMWESKYYQPIVGQFIGTKLDQAFLYEEKMDYELRQQLKYLIGQFYTEQAKEFYQLVKLNKQIGWLCGEISSKLYQYEWTYGGDMYAQIKLAPKLKPIMYISSVLYPFYTSLVGLPINTESEETYFEYEPIKKLVQLEQTLFQLRGTLKYSLFSGYQDKYPVGYEMWSPIEYYLQSGCHSVWKHLQMLERKLVFLKGIWLEKQLKSYLMQRLTDYEVVPTITTKFGDKIKYIKSVFSKHYQLPTYEAYWPAQGHYLFTTPESFVQHHEQFDKLWSLFNEFEFGTIWGELTGLNSYYSPSFGKDLDYPFFNPIGKQYFGSNYSSYRYPTSYLTSKYEAYPYGEYYSNESFKPYKPYLSRSSVFSTSYVPLSSPSSSASKVFGGLSNPIDTVIGELESELTKIKVQKEMPYEFPTTFPSSVYPVTSFIPSSASSFF